MAKDSIRWPAGMISCKRPIHALPHLDASRTDGFAAKLVREQHRIMRADLLVFVFPLWWGTRARFAHRVIQRTTPIVNAEQECHSPTLAAREDLSLHPTPDSIS